MTLWAAVLFVFVFRLLDITLETARTILVIHKYTWMPSIISFVEVFAWVWIFNEIVVSHHSFWIYAAYAGGYSMGTFCGCKLGHYIVGRWEK